MMISYDNRASWLTEKECREAVAFVLKDPNDFELTQHKVMRYQTGGFLLPCVKMSYNGNVLLYYPTREKRSLDYILHSAQPAQRPAILCKVLQAVAHVESVGFLRGENLCVAFARIYLDSSTGDVNLIYLPCAKGFFSSAAEMEAVLRRSCCELLGEEADESVNGKSFREALSNPDLPLNALLSEVGFGSGEEKKPEKKQMRLHTSNNGQEIVIPIRGERFTIGRDPTCDFVVSFNDYIGRKHCRIDVFDNKFFIFDLNSTNHTYLNQKQLKPGMEYPLKNGDQIAMANSGFRVVIE